MATPPIKYWFPAKTYGYGWGPPSCWQGWVVVALYAAALAACAIALLPQKRTVPFVVCAVLLTLVLVFICRIKGEPPRWRWGKDRE